MKKQEKRSNELSSLTNAIREDSVLAVNLVIMMVAWCMVSMCYYINIYNLKYSNGEFLLNYILVAVSEIFGLLVSRYFFQRYGIKYVLSVSQFFCVTGAVGLAFFDYRDSEDAGAGNVNVKLLCFLCMIAFGNNSSFGALYWANLIFPI